MNTNKIATGSTSKRLLAALAVLAVAFVVLAAVPAIADNDSDAAVSLTAPTNGAEAKDVSAVSDITGYDDKTGVVTLTTSANWTLKADIAIKGLVLDGNNLTITSYNEADAKTKAVYTLTIQSNDNSVYLLDTAGKSALLSIQGANLSIIDNASEMQGADTPSTGKNRSNVGSLYLDADDAKITFSSSAAGHKFSTGNAVIDLKDSELTETTVGGMAGAWYLKMEKSTFTATGATYTDASVYVDAKNDSKIVAGNLNIYAGKLVDSAISANTIGFYAGSVEPGTVFTDSTLSLRTLAVDKDSAVKAGTFYSNAFSASGEAVMITGAGSVTGDLAFVLDTVSNGKAVNRINTAGFSLSGVTFNGTASYTDGGITSTATLTNVVGDSFTPLVVSAGSIELKGIIDASTVDTTQDITVTGDAKLSGTLTIPEGVTLTIAERATLTVDDTNVLQLDSVSSLKAEGSLVQTGTASVKVKSGNDYEATYIEGSVYQDQTSKLNYVVKTVPLAGKTVALGVVIAPIQYDGAEIAQNDIVPNTIVISNGGYDDLTVSFTRFDIIMYGLSEPGDYTRENVVEAQVTVSSATGGTNSTPVSASKNVYAGVEITKILLTTDMLSFENLTYTGGVLTPEITTTTDYALSADDLDIVYSDGTSGVAATSTLPALSAGSKITVEGYTDKQIVNAGVYTATVTVKDSAAYYYTDEALAFTDKVLVYLAVPEIVITVDPATWTYATYEAKSAYVTLPSTYAGAVSVQIATDLDTSGEPDYGTATNLTLDSTAKVYYLDDVLDTIGSLTGTEDITVYIKVSAAADSNYTAGTQTASATVEPFVALEDYVKFTKTETVTSGYEAPTVSQSGYAVALTGKVTDTDSSDKYSYKLNVTMAVNSLVTLDFSSTGNAAFSEVDGVTVTLGNATNNVYTVSIVISKVLPVTTPVELTVTAAEDETVYTTQTYSIDLSGLIPDVYSIILSENGAEKDITELVTNADAPFLVLPATQGSTNWTLGSATYQPGSVYVIDAKDMVEGVITFTATGSSVTPVEPVEATSYTVSIVTVDGTAKVLIAAQSGYIPEGTGSVTVYFINPQTGLPDSAQLSYTVENADKASVVYADIENTTSYTIEGGQAVYNGVRSNVTQFAIAAAQE